MKQTQKETLDTIETTGIEAVKRLQADIFSALTENEFSIVRALYESKYAISARTIQGSIAKYKIQVETHEKRQRDEPIEELIKSARYLNVSIPSYTTVIQLLGSLKDSPLVGEREPSEGERADFVYFLRPAAREYAEEHKIFD